jgi:hypothetical protein
MSQVSQGPGWWQTADLKWYPPELHPDYGAPLPPPPTPPPPPKLSPPAAPDDVAEASGQAPPPPELPSPPARLSGSPGRSARGQVIECNKLGSLTKIGQGGQGVVYRAPKVTTKFAPAMVYKEYRSQALAGIDFTALAAMPALVEESLTYTQAERLISIAAWPCRIVEDAGAPAGFVMPAIPQEFFIALTTVKGVSHATAEFQHLLNHPSVLAARGITVDDTQRVTLLREVASGLAFLHQHGVCVGDISPKNLLFTLIPHEGVYFIDCDAMRINGVSALPQVETPGWEVPAGEELATVYSDTYKLGLLALRMLTGDQDTTNPAHLPATTPAQLGQIITDTLTNPPHQRPLPEAWTSVLGHAIEEAQHRAKNPPPVSAESAPPPPAIPIVHSRPPVGVASAPPSPPLLPTDHLPPQTVPTALQLWWWRQRWPAKAAAGATALQLWWRRQRWPVKAAAYVVILVALTVFAVALARHNNGASSSAPPAGPILQVLGRVSHMPGPGDACAEDDRGAVDDGEFVVAGGFALHTPTTSSLSTTS